MKNLIIKLIILIITIGLVAFIFKTISFQNDKPNLKETKKIQKSILEILKENREKVRQAKKNEQAVKKSIENTKSFIKEQKSILIKRAEKVKNILPQLDKVDIEYKNNYLIVDSLKNEIECLITEQAVFIHTNEKLQIETDSLLQIKETEIIELKSLQGVLIQKVDTLIANSFENEKQLKKLRRANKFRKIKNSLLTAGVVTTISYIGIKLLNLKQ